MAQEVATRQDPEQLRRPGTAKSRTSSRPAASFMTRSTIDSQLAGRASSVPLCVAATKIARGTRQRNPEDGSKRSTSVRTTSPPRLWHTTSATDSSHGSIRKASSSAWAFCSGVSESCDGQSL